MKLKSFTIAFCFCAIVTLAADVTFACSCLPKGTVLESFEESDVVIIARIISVQKSDPADKQHYFVDGVRSTTFIVEKVYKGNIRVRDELVFAQGGGGDCIWPFKEEYIGESFLFYLNTPKTESPLWVASTCGRSRGLKRATEDLLYLDNLKKLRGKTRVSGEYGKWNGKDFEIANKKIRFVGQKKTYETKTDENGVYEIYDLPPGQYQLEPEIQKGWRLDPSWLRQVAGLSEKPNPTGALTFTLEAKKHVSIDLSFQPDNSVEGSVVDSSGNPIEGVCVFLWTPKQTEIFGPYDCTDAKGEFQIESISKGSYVLVVNPHGATSEHNFRKFYYPSVTEREKAALIDIGAGETVKNIDLVVPKMLETVSVSGVLRYADETPMAGHRIQFKGVPVDGIRGDVETKTDGEGRFTFQLIKGQKGEIFSEFLIRVWLYENCPQLAALIEPTNPKFVRLKTPRVKIEAAQDLKNLVLRFPIPKCNLKNANADQ